MENLTNLIRCEIKRQFKSVRKFAEFVGIPQTTVASTLKNGVGGTAYETIVKICTALNIRTVNFNSYVVIDDVTLDIINKLNTLDDMGKHTVSSVTQLEYQRCNKEDNCDIEKKADKKFKSVNAI